jgi:hypothetical protein
MAQLGQFDLQLAFVSAGALGEDIEDKAGPVHDPALEQTLQVALLGRVRAWLKMTTSASSIWTWDAISSALPLPTKIWRWVRCDWW